MDFAKAKANGVTAVMCRCAYGCAKDVKFDAFAKAAEAAKMPIGAYIFATWHYCSVSKNFTEAKKNAAFQTKKALTFLSGKKISAPVAIDIELEKGEELKLTKAQLTEIAEYAAGIIRKAGYTPMIYSSASWFTDRLNPDGISCPLWIAYYTESFNGKGFPDTKYGKVLEKLKSRLALWQYSSLGKGSLYGCGSAFVDMNMSFGFEKLVEAPVTVTQPEAQSVYTVKIKPGSWYIRSFHSTDSPAKTVIKGGVTLQASQKYSGWHYIPSEGGWIGPAAIESSVYNKRFSYYTVKSGDTLSEIASRYSVTVDEILEENTAAYPRMTRNFIRTGWKLKIPAR